MSEITSVLQETRFFQPSAPFQKEAHINNMSDYDRLWQLAKDHPEEFWGEQASNLLHWFQPFSKVLTWKEPFSEWFSGGKLNASYNCLDRHLERNGDKIAIIWEGEPGEVKKLTYRELFAEVCRFANALRTLGMKKGEKVSIYMPMVPELAVAVLACARLGLPHSVVFAGFSAEALEGRNNDAEAKLVLTADGGYRNGKTIPLKRRVDESLVQSPTVKLVVVLKRTGEAVAMKAGRDFWWHDLIKDASEESVAEPMDSEHPLFLLYTSGSTGKPKGILHTTAGYLLGATLSTKYVFDIKDNDVFWCTADVGWITGHSYVIYGPLSNGATVVMYEGGPVWPEPDRFWQIIERHKVTIFYTAPTAIRTFIKCGRQWPAKRDLSSLRLLGTVGEPINPEAWMWYRSVIGGDRCPIVDTWWQTETGSIMISPLPGCTPTTPGSATRPFFGVVADVVDMTGKSLSANEGGYLVIRKPWPSMLRTIYKDDERYKKTYWSHIPGCYFTGDGARRDENGNFWIMGRIDDVLNVSGHRLSTMEVESALVSHSNVAEAAVVGKPHDIKGESICCFVTLERGHSPSPEFAEVLKNFVVKQIGSLARPDDIRFTEALPKTRSGKIMRRLLRDVASGRDSTGDMSTLEDFSVLAKLREDET